MLLSGQACTASTDATEALEYTSALSILQSSEEGSRCKFQGVLLICDDIPRDVQYAEGSPRKRKSTTAEGKAIDIILLDKTAPISACLWGEAAEEICYAWRQVQERRKNGEVVACIVDLSKVRIQEAARNSWNGKLLTRRFCSGTLLREGSQHLAPYSLVRPCDGSPHGSLSAWR